MRISLILTMPSPRSHARDPGHTGDHRHPSTGQTLHHLLRLIELFEQGVHGSDRGSAASSDPRATASVDDSGVASLTWGHRRDDGLRSADLLLIHLDVLQ